MTQDYELLFRQGTLSALRGDTADAIAAFESCRRLAPDSVAPVLPLLERYAAVGDARRADEVARELRRRWPDDPLVRLSLARWDEEQGRASEALELLRGGGVDLGPKGNAFPDYLRLLLVAGEVDAVLREARAALESDSVWRADALLASALAHLRVGDSRAARDVLGRFDPDEYPDLIAFWKDRLYRTGVLPSFSRLLGDASAANPGDIRLAALHRRLAT